MAEFIWKKEKWYNRVIYCLGWLNVLSLFFWISILIVGNLNYGSKFWNKTTHFVVYVWGWIMLVVIASIPLLLIQS